MEGPTSLSISALLIWGFVRGVADLYARTLLVVPLRNPAITVVENSPRDSPTLLEHHAGVISCAQMETFGLLAWILPATDLSSVFGGLGQVVPCWILAPMGTMILDNVDDVHIGAEIAVANTVEVVDNVN